MVKNRNPILVILFTLITFGIYGIYWIVVTTNELKELGQDVMSPWMLLCGLIPIAGPFIVLYYMWKYYAAVEGISGGQQNKILLFVLHIVIAPVSIYLAQTELNKKA